MRTYPWPGVPRSWPGLLAAAALTVCALAALDLLEGPAAPQIGDWETAVTAAIPQDTERSPSLAELRANLDESDLASALQAIDHALSTVGDGGTYVWSKSQRHLVGLIKPTSAFKSSDGRMCRHLVYTLSLGTYSRSIEGIACREPNGTWLLSG